MRILLIQDVEKLGKVGEEKDVAEGFGRNFLLPRKLAVLATPQARQQAEVEKKAQLLSQARTETELAEMARRLEGVELKLKAKVGTKERLYGAITAAAIARELKTATGWEIDKRKIELEAPIKALGNYEVVIKLSPVLAPKVKVVVEEEKAQP